MSTRSLASLIGRVPTTCMTPITISGHLVVKSHREDNSSLWPRN
jgi:hypothetical protein